MKEPVIRFDQVCKSYPLYKEFRGIKHFLFDLPRGIQSIRQHQFEALRDISFEVNRGENFGIIGRNGAGKSTTLGLIAGVLKPTSGRVSVRGRVSPLLSLGAGFHPDLNGRENIVLNGVLLGLTRREVMQKIDEIVEFSELGEFIDRPIRVYSSGMMARLGFSVVAHLEPEILLIDEVLGVGDAKFQKKCQAKMMSFTESHVTVVLVSHSLSSIISICDRALWIEDHVVRMVGDPMAIAEQYCKVMGVEFDPADYTDKRKPVEFTSPLT